MWKTVKSNKLFAENSTNIPQSLKNSREIRFFVDFISESRP